MKPSRKPREASPAASIPLVNEFGALSTDVNGKSRFFDSSSGVHFLKTLVQTLKQHGNINIMEGIAGPDDDETFDIFNPTPNEQIPTILPNFDLATALSDEFFKRWSPLMPVLHRGSFFASMTSLYKNGDNFNDFCFLFTFYIVLATSLRLQPPTSGLQSVASDLDYFRKANQHIAAVLSASNLKTVQALVCMFLYLSSRYKPHATWQLSGLIVSISLQIGLHRHPHRFKLGPIESEMRKRTFWCVYTVNMLVCASQGLPRQLRDQDIDVDYPNDLDDDFLDSEELGLRPLGEVTEMSAALAIWRIARILSLILEELCTSNRQRFYSNALDLDEKLDSWRQNLPRHLRFEITSEIEIEGLPRPCGYLQFLFYYLKILIYRPVLTLDSESPQFKVALQVCAKASRSIILLSDCFTADSFPRVLWPIEVSVIWLAGSMVLFHDWHTQVQSDSQIVISKCINSLNYFGHGRDSVTKRVTSLEQLGDSILNQPTSRRNMPLLSTSLNTEGATANSITLSPWTTPSFDPYFLSSATSPQIYQSLLSFMHESPDGSG